MKSSLEKLGRKLSMHRSDGKEKRDHQPPPHLDELAQASKDMQDMRDCYDGLLSAAAAMANSIYEFSESLNQMANCLLGKTAADADVESGKVLSTLGNMQLELQKIADTYRSYVIVTITNPSESLLCELRKVEEMKLQCDEKREVYEYMMAQHKEKGKLRNSKVESSVVQKLQEAQDEYDEVTRLCVFRVKSLKEGQCRSLLTQAARHHAAQLNFFRKGLAALEAVESRIRNVAEKHRIDYQLGGLYDGEAEPYDDQGELSFDYRHKKEGLDNAMELDRVDLEESKIKHQGEKSFGKQSYSAPLYPEKSESERPRETQPQRKFYSYVLPPPVVDSSRRPPASQNVQQPLPAPWADSKAKRQSYSGPLPPSKQFSFKMASSGPIASRSASPPPKISELHELPRPPGLSKGGLVGHSAPLFSKNQEISPPNKRAMLTSSASPLPPPPPPPPRVTEEAASPPLTPISLSNMKSLSTAG